MRFLHTADWHVGRSLIGRTRWDEHAAALDRVVEIASSEEVDVVLVAGDLYDQRSLSPEADQLIFQTLLRLHDAGIPVVVIPGNHDSAARFEAFQGILGTIGVHVVPKVSRPNEGGVVEVPSRDGVQTATVACVPFVPERRLIDAAQVFADTASAYAAYEDGMGEIFRAITSAFRPDRINILMAHAFIDKAKLGGGERELTVGEVYAIPPARLPSGASYVALGHVHRPQAIRRAPSPTRYSGSLLQLDFGEKDQDKCVFVVDASPGRPARIEQVSLKVGRHLVDLRGTLDELADQASGVGDAYLRVFVKTDGPTPGIADRVREILPNALRIHPEYEREESEAEGPQLRSLQPRDQFLTYYKANHGADPKPELLTAFDRIYEEVDSK